MATFTEIEYADFKNDIRFVGDDEGRTIFTLGYKSYIVKALVEAPGKCNILVGNYCSIAHNVLFIIGMNHNIDTVTSYPENLIGCEQIKKKQEAIEMPSEYVDTKNHNSYQISIGHDVWIGRGVTIMSGIKIGNGAVIGAQTVVAKDVPPYAVVVGNPGRVIKYRFDKDVIAKLQAIKWWYWPENEIIENKSLMNKPSMFVEKFYSANKENIIQDETSDYLKNVRKQGYNVYYFIPDFNWEQGLWQKVIKEYFSRYTVQDKVVLILEITDEAKLSQYMRMIYEWIDVLGNDAPLIIQNNSQNKLPLAVLQNTDVFITTQAYESIQCIDYVQDYGGKIVSGLNDIIFAE